MDGIEEPTEQLAGEVDSPSAFNRRSATRRFIVYSLVYLILLVFLVIKYFYLSPNPILYFILGFGVSVFGTWRALSKIRRDELERFHDAPIDAPLVLGGTGFWRELGLAWVDGSALHFAGTKSARVRFRRREITRIHYRAWFRELEIYAAPDGREQRYRLGSLISLIDLPRLHREVREWLKKGTRA